MSTYAVKDRKVQWSTENNALLLELLVADKPLSHILNVFPDRTKGAIFNRASTFGYGHITNKLTGDIDFYFGIKKIKRRSKAEMLAKGEIPKSGMLKRTSIQNKAPEVTDTASEVITDDVETSLDTEQSITKDEATALKDSAFKFLLQSQKLKVESEQARLRAMELLTIDFREDLLVLCSD